MSDSNSLVNETENADKWFVALLNPDNGACEKEPKSVKESIKYCYAFEISLLLKENNGIEII